MSTCFSKFFVENDKKHLALYFIPSCASKSRVKEKMKFPYFFAGIFAECTCFSVFFMKRTKKFTEIGANIYQKN